MMWRGKYAEALFSVHLMHDVSIFNGRTLARHSRRNSGRSSPRSNVAPAPGPRAVRADDGDLARASRRRPRLRRLRTCRGGRPGRRSCAPHEPPRGPWHDDRGRGLLQRTRPQSGRQPQVRQQKRAERTDGHRPRGGRAQQRNPAHWPLLPSPPGRRPPASNASQSTTCSRSRRASNRRASATTGRGCRATTGWPMPCDARWWTALAAT